MGSKFYVIDSSMSIICSFLYFLFFYLSCLPNTYVLLIFNILAHDQEGGYILWNVQLNNKLLIVDFIKGALTSLTMKAYLA
jgi:hypothetical protein